MADRGLERPMRGGERFDRAYEIRQRDRAVPALAVSRLIEPDDAIPVGEQWRDEASPLHAAPAPAMDQQDRRRVKRSGLPDGKRTCARDDRFPSSVDGSPSRT